MRAYKIFGWFNVGLGSLGFLGVLMEPDTLALVGVSLFIGSGIAIISLVDEIEKCKK